MTRHGKSGSTKGNADPPRLWKQVKEYPLVSIVTSSCNEARFIEETILLVKNQDYPNIEHLIVGGEAEGHGTCRINGIINIFATRKTS